MSVVAGHELMHALGFDHEQSRNDTQNYVIFRKKDEQSEIDPYTQNFGFDYDFGSVMHYGAKGDHKKGLYDRITLPRFYQQTIGQRERISFKDAAIINRIYCKDSCKGHEDKCQNGGYLNPNDCKKCHCPDGYGGQYCDALEENFNCEDLSGIPRELVANQSAVLLKTKAKCAKLCCAASLTDLNANQYKNWIEAEKADMDIVISARNVKLINSSKCVNADNLFAEKRNPGTSGFKCYDAVKHQNYDCSCHGDKKCLAEEKWTDNVFLCPIIKVNGIQIKESRQQEFTDPKDFRYNWTRIKVHCYKAEGSTVNFWGYSKPDTNELIRVDEIH
ncbi:hypothetical protein niasHT_001675 [Heterodera trifolii]|uniref:Metalloendopeptidase n=1 Tax=Heterodera trifolii TaxID=157864 RepID=A0ABD2MDQ1_9BILA